MLWLRRRSLLLMMLLMNNARGSRLLQMVRRWRTLLRVVGMMLHEWQLSATFSLQYDQMSMTECNNH
jgi:hypothetical protein